MNEFKERIWAILSQYMDSANFILLKNDNIADDTTRMRIAAILCNNCDEFELKSIVEMPHVFPRIIINSAVKALSQISEGKHSNNQGLPILKICYVHSKKNLEVGDLFRVSEVSSNLCIAKPEQFPSIKLTLAGTGDVEISTSSLKFKSILKD